MLATRRRSAPVSVPWSAVVGTALTSATYLVVWIAPTLSLELTRSMVIAFGLEFFIVHASLMVPAARSMHPSRGYLVAALYLLAAAGVGIGLGLWTFVSFTYLTVLEVLPALRTDGDDVLTTALAGGGKALLYFLVIVPALLLPIPGLGVTEPVAEALAFDLEGMGDPGPENLLFAGFVFFGVLTYVRSKLARN